METSSSMRDSAIGRSLDQGWQLPARFYADPALHLIEQEAIFNKAWQCVGRESALEHPGTWLSGVLGDTAIVVIRTRQGGFSGYVDLCRRCGRRLVAISASAVDAAAGCTCTWRCDGNAHRADAGENRERRLIALSRSMVRVAAFRGFLFANLASETEDLDAWLGNAGEQMTRLGIDFLSWQHAGTYTYDIEADWKLFAENSLECYHCPLVHRDTFSAYVAVQPRDYVTREFGNVLTHFAPITAAPGGGDPRGLKGFRLLFVWPNTFISEDDFVAIVARVTPLGPQRTRFVVDTFIDPGADQEAVRRWLDVYDRTFLEDKEVVAAQQLGYQCGRVSQGRLMVHREASIRMFQRRTWAALAGHPELSEAAKSCGAGCL